MKAYYDMAARFPWPAERGYYGRGFRLGDRAAAYIRALQWRQRHPDGYLTAIDDVSWPECADSAEFNAAWLFANLADEVRMLSEGERTDLPGGENLYDEHLWHFWKEVRFNPPGGLPIAIAPPPEATARARSLGFGRPFVVVQPLIDASYNEWRNQPWEWWMHLVDLLSKRVPVVVAAHRKHSDREKLTKSEVAYSWDLDLSPMEVLALAQRSALFVGGETGLSLWAPIMQVPTYGMIAQQSCHYLVDTAPISFGQPVRVQPLEAPPEHHLHWIVGFLTRYGLLA